MVVAIDKKVSLDEAVDFLVDNLLLKDYGVRGISSDGNKIVVRVDADFRYDVIDNLPREVIPSSVPYFSEACGYGVVYRRTPFLGRCKGRH